MSYHYLYAVTVRITFSKERKVTQTFYSEDNYLECWENINKYAKENKLEGELFLIETLNTSDTIIQDDEF